MNQVRPTDKLRLIFLMLYHFANSSAVAQVSTKSTCATLEATFKLIAGKDKFGEQFKAKECANTSQYISCLNECAAGKDDSLDYGLCKQLFSYCCPRAAQEDGPYVCNLSKLTAKGDKSDGKCCRVSGSRDVIFIGYQDQHVVNTLGMRTTLTKYNDNSTQRIFGTCIQHDTLSNPRLSQDELDQINTDFMSFPTCNSSVENKYPPSQFSGGTSTNTR